MHRLLLPAVFLSGVAALNYELLWMRELTLVVGSTSAAVSCVISVYFLGLALGNELAGRLARRLSHPLRAYIIIELLVAAWAILFHPFLGQLSAVYAGVYRGLDPHSPLVVILRIIGAALLLLPPTMCMGATLPLLAQFGARDRTQGSRWSALLYGFNTFGAMIGVFATGFFLIEHLGVPMSLRATASLNVLSAVCAALIARRPRAGAPRVSNDRATTPPVTPAMVRIVLLSFGLLGFANIAVEVLWTRLYALIFLNDTYIFSTILLVYLFGIGAGSVIAARIVTRVRHPLYMLGVLQMISAAWTVGMMLVMPAIVPMMDLSSTQFSSVLINYVLAVGAGALVPTLCMGASFPLLVRGLVERTEQTGNIVGRALAWNTVGGVFGSAVAGYLFLDHWGLKTGIIIATAFTVVVAAVLMWTSSQSRRTVWVTTLLILAPPMVGLAIRPLRLPDDILAAHFPPGGGFHILESAPSIHGDVAVTEESTGERRLWINSIWVARESAHMVMGYLPWLFHDGDVHSALGICCGTGRTFGALLNIGVDRLDLVEINPAVIDLSRKWFSRSNHGVLDDPRPRVIFDDGRNYVRYTDRTYDMITLEPLQMFHKGVVYFYTEEFYQQAKARLNDGGVLCQWAPTYLAGDREFKTMINTFVRVFPNAILWGQGVDMILLGFKTPGDRAAVKLDDIFARMSNAALREDLRKNFVYDRFDPLMFTLLDGSAMRELSADAGIYTDDRPQLEFTAPRNRDEKQSVRQNITLIKSRLVPLNSMFDLPDARVAERLTRLRELFLDLALADRGPQWDALTQQIIALRDELYDEAD